MDNLEGVSATTVKQVKLEQREGGERQACFVGASGNVLVMDSSKSDEDEAYVLGGSQIETESRETTAVESRRLLESRPGNSYLVLLHVEKTWFNPCESFELKHHLCIFRVSCCWTNKPIDAKKSANVKA